MMTDSMIDLETLGVGPRAAILTIGWCHFNPRTQELGDSGKVQVNVQSCIERGMVVMDSTIRWWLCQSEEARESLQSDEILTLNNALGKLALEINLKGIEHVWGNGANFDVSILETAHELCGMELPWYWYNVRCYRTLKALFPHVPKVTPKIPHCAASDAEAQAQHLLNIYREHGL